VHHPQSDTELKYISIQKITRTNTKCFWFCSFCLEFFSDLFLLIYNFFGLL